MKLKILPKDWKIVGLKEVIGFVKGKKPQKLIEEYKENYFPYLSTEYLRTNSPPNYAKLSSDLIIVNEGDIILLWDGSNAGEFFIGKKGILSSTMVKIQIENEDIDKKFLFYLLKKKEKFLQNQTRGTGIPHVDKSVLENLKIPLPPLPEQKAIAKILSTVDEAIQKVDLIIEKTERLKRGLMNKFLKNPDWPIKKVREHLKIVSGIKEIKARDYKKIGKFPIIDQSQQFIAGYSDDEERLFSKILPVIVFGDHTQIIKYVDFPFIVGASGTKILIPLNKEDDIKFLYHALQLVRIPEKSGGYARHSKELLEQNFRIPKNKKEQQKIASILSTVDKKLELEKKRKEKLERIKKGLMNDLLSGRKRVDVRRVLKMGVENEA